MSKSTNVSHWIHLVKAGDSAAANRIWQHYFDRLVRSIRGRLYGQNRAVSDEEDIVLSVFDSFYDAAENGRFPDLSDRDDLWQQLLRMSARKVVDKRRHEQRQRRGGSVKIHSLDHAGDDENVIEAIRPRANARNGADDAGIRRAIFFSFGCRAAQGISGCQVRGVFKRGTRGAIWLLRADDRTSSAPDSRKMSAGIVYTQ